MAATTNSDYYYNNTTTSYHHYHHHHQSQQQQNYYGASSSGQYDDCKNLNVPTANDAYGNYNYNLPNNYNNQWNHQHYNTIPNSTVPSHQHHHQQSHQQSHYLHHQHQQHQQQHNLNMLNNQINDDYKNYSNNNISSTKSIPDTIQHHQQPPTNVRNGEEPNLNCNQYIDRKDELFYVADVSGVCTAAAASPSTVNLIATNKINEAISYPTSQLNTLESKKRKIDNQTDEENDSPALRALLSNPSKKAKHFNSPYFYQSHGNLSPISSTDNYPQHYQLSSKPEEIMNLINYKPKDGFEQSIEEIQNKKKMPMDGKYSAVSLLSSPAATNSPMSSFLDNCIATPPTSPKDTKHDDSSDNLTTWNDQNGGKFYQTIICIMIHN